MTKIEWCDTTWNPVWGCLNSCPYCYARKIARRFGGQVAISNSDNSVEYDKLRERLVNYQPTFLQHAFRKKFPRKPSRIFVNSMSDIQFWKPEWMVKVLERAKAHPEHVFIYLTQDLSVYCEYGFPYGSWLGVTITDLRSARIGTSFATKPKFLSGNVAFCSVEPLLEPLTVPSWYNWLIIGSQTNPYRPPKREWVQALADSFKGPVFMKNNLRPVMGKDLRQEFPI